MALWQSFKPLPEGLRMSGEPIPVAAEKIRFLADTTAVDHEGRSVVRQEIFDRMLGRIDNAREMVLVDNFLFNSAGGHGSEMPRQLCGELTDALVAAKGRRPDMPVLVITDPINEIYGGTSRSHFKRLRSAGVQLVFTDLTRLRDSNALYSSWWRLGPRWLGNKTSGGSFPSPFDPAGDNVTLRSWMALLNFKANHRKILLTDDGNGAWGFVIGSLNAHDGSSAHSNLALEIDSTALAGQIWEAETAVLRLSGVTPPERRPIDDGVAVTEGAFRAQVLTEGAIRDQLIEALAAAGKDTKVDVAVFYLSHRAVIAALVSAAKRGADLRVILDPSKDAFGRTKNGIPNRQAAQDLIRKSDGRIRVRWYDTHGEQFHPKMMVVRRPQEFTVILGSANFTRRNLDDLNLEADLRVDGPLGSPLDRDLAAWFDRLWTNDGFHFTVPYETYEDGSKLRRITARIQERTGLCTF